MAASLSWKKRLISSDWIGYCFYFHKWRCDSSGEVELDQQCPRNPCIRTISPFQGDEPASHCLKVHIVKNKELRVLFPPSSPVSVLAPVPVLLPESRLGRLHFWCHLLTQIQIFSFLPLFLDALDIYVESGYCFERSISSTQ